MLLLPHHFKGTKYMGKLQLVSTGAGGSRYLTNEAIKAIQEADLVVGYTKYVKDLKDIFRR